MPMYGALTPSPFRYEWGIELIAIRLHEHDMILLTPQLIPSQNLVSKAYQEVYEVSEVLLTYI